MPSRCMLVWENKNCFYMTLPHIIVNKNTNKDTNLRDHVARHSQSANENTEALGGEWFNFLKVKLYGMGGGRERIWGLFHEHT